MVNDKPKATHGGKREGAGRKARFGVPMKQTTVRLPQEWIDRLTADFGSIQQAIEILVQERLKQ